MGRRLGYLVLVGSACVFLAAGPAAAVFSPISDRFAKPATATRAEKRALGSTTTSVPQRPPRALRARALVLSDIPGIAVTGVRYTFSLRAVTRDARTATRYRGTVVFTSTDKAAEVDPSPYTFGPEDAGEHHFTVTFHTPGRHWLHVKDTVNLSLSTEQGRILVTDDPVALVAAAVSAASQAQALANAITHAAQAGNSATSSSTSTTSTTSTTSSTGSTTSTTPSAGSTTSSSSSTSTTIGSGTSSTAPASTTSTTPAGSTGGGGSTTSSSSSTTRTSTTVAVRRETAEVSNPQPQQGQTVQVTGGKEVPFAPDQELTVELRSDPVVLGSTRSEANGSYIAEVTIPEDAPPGEHEIVVSGAAFDGIGRVESVAAVTVVGAGGSSSAGATGGSGASSSGGSEVAASSEGGFAESESFAGGASSLGRTGWSPGLLKLALALGFVGMVLVRTGKPGVGPSTGRSALGRIPS